MAIQDLGDGNPDGTRLGLSATEKIGFLGATPVIKQTAALAAALTAGETTPADVAAAVVQITAALVAYGLL